MFHDLKQRYGARLVTLFIVFVLAVQFVIGLTPKQRLWPFLPYRMYHQVKVDGQRLGHLFNVYGVLKDSSKIALNADDLDMTYWFFRKNVQRGIRNGDARKTQSAIEWLCAQSGGELASLQIEDLGIAISRDGPVYGLEPNVEASLDVSCP
jgi:hypothetical protein